MGSLVFQTEPSPIRNVVIVKVPINTESEDSRRGKLIGLFPSHLPSAAKSLVERNEVGSDRLRADGIGFLGGIKCTLCNQDV